MSNNWEIFVYGNKSQQIKGLAEISGDQYLEDLPGIKLFASIIAQAGKDRDVDYFTNELFETHCWWLRLDSDFVYSLVRQMWKLEDDSDSF